MPDPGKPSRDELTQAMSVAWALRGTTNVTETEHAVYAHGVEVWVCPNCLAVTPSTKFLPLSPGNCQCGATLQP